MFHVERDPVQVASALFRASADKTMNIGIDDLQRQRGSESRCAASLFAIHVNLEPLPAITHTDGHRPPILLEAAKQHELLLTVANQAHCRRPPKGFPAAQIRQRLQQTCLAGGVRAIDQVVVFVRFQLDAAKTTEITCTKLLNRHPQPTGGLIGASASRQICNHHCQGHESGSSNCCPAPKA